MAGSTGSERLRSQRDFMVVLSGQAVSEFGDAVSMTVLPLLVLHLTGSAALVGVVAGLQLVPDLVFGLFAGALADRWDRRRMMLVADLGRAILVAAVPLAYWLGLPTMTVLLLVVVPIACLRVLWAAGFTSAIPGLVGPALLGKANSVMEATFSVGYLLGPVIGGVLVAVIGAAQTLVVDAVSFGISAAALLLVRRRMAPEREEVPVASVLAEIREGVSFVAGHRLLRLLIGYWGAMSLATAGLVPMLSYYITVDLDQGPELFGLLGSIWSAGYLLGSIVAGRLAEGSTGRRMVMAGLVIAVCVVVIAVTSVPAVYLTAGFFIGAALAVMLVLYATTRAALTPDRLLGRVGSTARTISLGLQPVAMVGAGTLVAVTDGRTTLVVMACLAGGASLLFARPMSHSDAQAQAG
jgi:MFS family permease